MNVNKWWGASIIALSIFVTIIAAGITGANGSEGGAGRDGEESGQALALDETYDEVRAGARLLMAYDAASNSFYGLVQNTTDAILSNVRVEVHLSNGVELGPTADLDLEPGEVACVMLPATKEPFDGWSPHAEVGQGEGGTGEHGPENEVEVSGDGGRAEHGDQENDGD